MSDIKTKTGIWDMQPDKNDTISGTDILKHTHTFDTSNLPLPGPDYKRRVPIYMSKFAEANTKTTKYNYVFKLIYPCFFIATRNRTSSIDNDIFMQMSAYSTYCISYYVGAEANIQRWQAITKRDSTYQLYFNCGTQNMFNGFPLGATNYWHHIAAGAIGSSDGGDKDTNWLAYLIPYYGTPKDQLLAKVYSAAYTGVKAHADNNKEYVISKVTSVSWSKDIIAP